MTKRECMALVIQTEARLHSALEANKQLLQTIDAYEIDAEWRRAWHTRLGRGNMIEGQFYEALEGRLPKKISLVLEGSYDGTSVCYIASSQNAAEHWAITRVRENALKGCSHEVWVETLGLDGDDLTPPNEEGTWK